MNISESSRRGPRECFLFFRNKSYCIVVVGGGVVVVVVIVVVFAVPLLFNLESYRIFHLI